jgi:chloramphenicol 3-O phosphotransferase
VTAPGQIVILNGAPRSGKSSIAAVIQESFDGVWINLGVDIYMQATPKRFLPGIGLRPGGERPDLEPMIVSSYAALYDAIAAHSRLGLNVVADFGHHDFYSKPLGILFDCAKRLAGLPVLFVGVFCPLPVIMERRGILQPGRDTVYETGTAGDPVPLTVRRFQEAVHRPGIYDLTVDTSVLSPEACAAAIRKTLDAGPALPTAFERLAAMS